MITRADAIKILVHYHDAAWEAMHRARTRPEDRHRAELEVRAFALAIRALERDERTEDAL
jgi:hypothetical protein